MVSITSTVEGTANYGLYSVPYRAVSAGSGVIFAEDESLVYVATNEHVVDEAQNIAIAFDDAEDIYIVTLSDRLSGSCNAANQAVTFYREEGGEHNVHVFNSRSASAGQVQAALLIRELAEQGLPFQEVVDRVERYLDEMDTMFVLENLDNLRKNGRLTKVQALVTSSLRIKLLMGSTPEGEIRKLSQGFSERQALHKMIQRCAGQPHHGKRLVIAHCNCLERAQYVRELAEKLCSFREILITATGGISTVYAYDGGIVIAY